jgi:hypothetical protein
MQGSYDPTRFKAIDEAIRETLRELDDAEWGSVELSGERFEYLNGMLRRLKAKQADGEVLDPLF